MLIDRLLDILEFLLSWNELILCDGGMKVTDFS